MDKLTERELEILQLLKNGYENHEIAKRIHVSKHTVKAHVSSIIHKTSARNRTHLVYIATRHGLIK